MVLSRKYPKNYIPCLLFLNGVLLEQMKKYKYLGVWLTDDLIWSTHIEAIIACKSRRLLYVGFIFRTFSLHCSPDYHQTPQSSSITNPGQCLHSTGPSFQQRQTDDRVYPTYGNQDGLKVLAQWFHRTKQKVFTSYPLSKTLLFQITFNLQTAKQLHVHIPHDKYCTYHPSPCNPRLHHSKHLTLPFARSTSSFNSFF